MQRDKFLERLDEQVLLCDGAMGTQLMAAGLELGACGELWNIANPDAVIGIHARYESAGCDCVTTNSFCGSAPALERHGLAGRAAELSRAAALLARQATGGRCTVLGDVGPFGGFLEPLGDMEPEYLLQVFRQQIEALRSGGVDGIIIETMADPAESAIAIHAARDAGNWPVIATFAFQKAGSAFRTMMGTTVKDAMNEAIDAGADVVGANCGTDLDLDDYARLADQLCSAAGDTPVILQPNAGAPRIVGDRAVHPATPDDMAALAEKLIGAGVRMIGGCCGTTPEHLRAVRRVLDEYANG